MLGLLELTKAGLHQAELSESAGKPRGGVHWDGGGGLLQDSGDWVLDLFGLMNGEGFTHYQGACLLLAVYQHRRLQQVMLEKRNILDMGRRASALDLLLDLLWN